MRLKSLDLVGFKSFLEPTVISFAPGITAVAGPNGCGKSNVMDAIRWVLGEQAASRLRGRSVEDLIYAGNENNPAAGMAEVSLTLEAGETALPEPYSSLSEVCITRRAYRSGESEYLLNKIQCRLKDIAEFFMAAGIHSRGYALVEQGRVGEIIQAKPIELRGVIEEAAGLGLFKGRREMSERKLERVQENLSRVNDVLAEIERQLNYSRRQAKKAEAYKIVRAELAELERLAAARRLIGVRAQFAFESQRESELRSQSDNSRSEVGALESSAQEASAAVSAERERLASVSRELDAMRATSADRSRAREFLTLRLGAINDEEPAALARLGELETKATGSRAASAAAAARLAREMRFDDGGDESGLAILNTRTEAARAELRESERRTENLKDELSEIIREAAVIRGRLADLSGERAELEERLLSADNESAASSMPALEGARNDLGAARDELERLKSQLAEFESAHSAGAELELESGAAASRLAAQLQNARETLQRAERRAAIHQNRPVAVRLRGVLDSLNGDRPAAEPPSLLDVIKAPAQIEPALRAVMGEQLDAVIVDSPHFAARAIEILKEQQAGRLSFVPEASYSAAVPAIDAPGIVGRLVDMLEFEPRFAATAEALLGHVMVAEDVPSALAASNLNGHGTVFVTRDGDLIWPGRLISGGSDNGSNAAEDHEPQISVDEARALAESAQRDCQAAEGRLAELRASRAETDRRIGEVRRQIGPSEKNLEQKRRALAAIENQIALAQARDVDARRRLVEIGEASATGNERLEKLAHDEQRSRAALAAISGETAGKKTAAEELGRALIEAKAKVEARRATLRGLEQDLSHLRRITREFEAQIDALAAALEHSRSERIEFERELSKLAAQEEENRARETVFEQELETIRAECARLENTYAGRRAALETAREYLSQLEREAVECGLARERASVLTEELERSFREKFQADFAASEADFQVALTERDSDADELRLTELRAKAERIGEVNLAAESEVHELEERASGLNAEKADLEAAVEDLTQTINKLNREARRRFSETFEGAARNFAEIFPKLMRGGAARLELEQGDMLEAGVNIMVQPVGKKVKELGLLSGGEKALSAMALIFSLFLLNPSPFCVMDEVDAPLDEFSLAAFADMIEELKERSQFIVITHNQRTMQRADQVYGVTMNRPGISKVISLRIPRAA